MSWCRLCPLWFVQLIVATCCFVHLCLCLCVRALPLSSKWGDKGGAESLMSSLTGRIHVSLPLPTNTCCSGWGKNPPNAAMQHTTNKGMRQSEEERGGKKVSGPRRHVWRAFFPGCLQENDLLTTTAHLYIWRCSVYGGSLNTSTREEVNRACNPSDRWPHHSCDTEIPVLCFMLCFMLTKEKRWQNRKHLDDLFLLSSHGFVLEASGKQPTLQKKPF